MDSKIEIIKEKLKALERKDRAYQIFGASKHCYRKKGRLYEHEVKTFEKRYNIELPPDYKEFILQVTNGGPGPYYGLESLEDSLYQDLDYKKKTDLTNPGSELPLTEAWNMDFKDLDQEQYDQMQKEYFDNKWTNGLLRISNFGCGVSMNLVVNGHEYGNIWVDDRGNDGGIYPDQYFGNEGRIGFLSWYDAWLDNSLNELAGPDGTPKSKDKAAEGSKPWWKTLFEQRK